MSLLAHIHTFIAALAILVFITIGFNLITLCSIAYVVDRIGYYKLYWR